MNFHVEACNPAMDKNNIALHVASKTGMCLQSTFHSPERNRIRLKMTDLAIGFSFCNDNVILDNARITWSSMVFNDGGTRPPRTTTVSPVHATAITTSTPTSSDSTPSPQSRTRKLFPETWLWSNSSTGYV